MAINVTKSYLPDLDKYQTHLKKIYDTHWLTNAGPFVQELTERLQTFLGVKNLLLVANATIGLQVAYKALNLKGEVITSPFSFVATTSSLVWENLTPVFTDIEPQSLCLDPLQIEAKITDKTSAILPIHVYGNACEVEQIDVIAKKYNLKTIYDAAHAFNVQYKGKSILNYGDISILSFHATKLFHCVEGGALIIQDDALFKKAKEMINFGFDSGGSGKIIGLGINAKMSDFHAAMGLCVLDDIHDILKKRQKIDHLYRQKLPKQIKVFNTNPNGSSNYAYFPILFKSEERLLTAIAALQENNIFPRRYFYPALNTLPYVEYTQMPMSEDIAKRILCLPFYVDLSNHEIIKICEIIAADLKGES